jgi:hypothetical protein
MFTMTVGVMAMAMSIPESLRPAVVEAASRWFAGRGEAGSLEPARVACWRFLEAKNGDSTTVADRTHIAVRSLICLLCDQPDEGADLETGWEFFAQLAQRFGGLEDALGLPR